MPRIVSAISGRRSARVFRVVWAPIAGLSDAPTSGSALPAPVAAKATYRPTLPARAAATNLALVTCQRREDTRLPCSCLSRYMIHHIRHVARAKPGGKLSPGHLSNGFADARELAGITAAGGRTPPSFHEIRSLGERLYREQYGADFAQPILGHKKTQPQPPNMTTCARKDGIWYLLGLYKYSKRILNDPSKRRIMTDF
jgi:integrase